MRTTTVDVLPVHPTLRDPVTGQPLRALGIGRRGPIWPALGGSDDDGGGDSGDSGSPDENAAPGQEPGPDPDPPTGQNSEAGQPAGKPPKIEGEFDRERAERLVENLRGSVTREKQKRAAAEKDKQEAEQRFQAVFDTIAKAAGLKKDADEPADPEELVRQLASKDEQVAAKDAEARQLRIELAVHEVAPGLQADTKALLDSRTFLAAVADLDPADGDFADQLADAIKAVIKANPSLKAAPAKPEPPAKSGTEVPAAPGRGERKRPTSLFDAVTRAYGT
ncbi:hypothetical protein GCM10012275_54580 [Longimycelium tulufanense]|uniref:Scaffolding protein n=1 Tax=Longimycelium tulufanense TaxID=907463 RepID=A0A8J3FZ33_9PSEU|nr:hypothetical protein [Longimycelium tulufanense]GGM77018.1 hypothetical protein GCM10012275_54580 [Longimycelium tulufanense]